VTKSMKEGVEFDMTYDVEDIFSHPALIDVWLNPLHYDYGCGVTVVLYYSIWFVITFL